MSERDDLPEDLPEGLSNDALRSLRRAGYTRIDQLTAVRASELGRMRGMGSKAIGQIRVALAARGHGLADEDDQ